MYFNGTKCCLLIFCSVLSLSVIAKDAKKIAEGQGLVKPLCFVENKGQVKDLDNNPRTDIQYKLSTPGMDLYVGNGQLHYQFNKIEGDLKNNPSGSSYRMDVMLIGANPAAKVVTADNNRYYERYYNENTGSEGVVAHAYNRVTYKNVYPNIDWVVYVKNNKVEYDFVVNPGGDASQIRFKYDGATDLSVNADGNLSAKTPIGAVEEKKPYAEKLKKYFKNKSDNRF